MIYFAFKYTHTHTRTLKYIRKRIFQMNFGFAAFGCALKSFTITHYSNENKGFIH